MGSYQLSEHYKPLMCHALGHARGQTDPMHHAGLLFKSQEYFYLENSPSFSGGRITAVFRHQKNSNYKGNYLNHNTEGTELCQ